MIEGWMIEIGFALIVLVAGYAVLRSNVTKSMQADAKQDLKIEALEKFMNEKKPLLDHLSRVEEAFGKKIDFQAKELVELKTKLANVPTMEEVRGEFVSKEMFKQLEKHMDEKFDTVQSGIDKILNKLDKAQS